MQIDAAAILRWALAGGVPRLARHGFGPVSRCACDKFSHGQSNPTFLVTVSHVSGGLEVDDRFVVRCQPRGKLLPSAHRIDREHAMYLALAGSDVPVPAVYGYCSDPSVIGVEFYAMEYVIGRVFMDAALQGLAESTERNIVYRDAMRVLSRIAGFDTKRTRLHRAGQDSQSWARRQLSRWTAQFHASRAPGNEYPEMNSLIHALEVRLTQLLSPVHEGDDEQASPTLVHGDFTLSNCIFHPSKPVILAVIDWELCSLGDPIADLATFLTPHYLDPAAVRSRPEIAGAYLPNPLPPGVPTREEMVSVYAQEAKMPVAVVQQRLSFHSALALFRLAAIGYGIAARARAGNASSKGSNIIGEDAALVFVRAGLAAAGEFSIVSPSSACLEPLVDRVGRFINTEILPLESNFHEHVTSDSRWTVWAPIERLKSKAKEAGLWNLWLPKSLGGKLTACEYAPIAELMGRCSFAAESFNCSAPDTGNMELLARFGTPHQKEKWLQPLLNGEIRSCFAMTEPDVASSDPTNLAATIVRQGPMYVVNGHKWWTTGAKDPRCHLILFLGRGPNAEHSDSTHRRHTCHSIVLIPMKSRGVRLIRHLTVMGYDDAPHGHAEMEYRNVTVPIAEALLLGEGRGFEAAQSRLGGGRLHHCMRAVGFAERALELMIDRATARKAFDRNLSQFDSVLQFIAESRCDIEQGRHAVLRAAASVDNGDMRSARRDVAVAKIVVPRLVHNVIDRAVQVHGALGVSQDTVLAAMLAMTRSLRLADGPDEVHLVTVANMELRTRRKSLAKL